MAPPSAAPPQPANMLLPPLPPRAWLLEKTQETAVTTPVSVAMAPPNPWPPGLNMPVPFVPLARWFESAQLMRRSVPPLLSTALPLSLDPFTSPTLLSVKDTPGCTVNRRTALPPLMTTLRPVASNVTSLPMTIVLESRIEPSQSNVAVPPAAIAARRAVSSQVRTGAACTVHARRQNPNCQPARARKQPSREIFIMTPKQDQYISEVAIIVQQETVRGLRPLPIRPDPRCKPEQLLW